MHKPAMKIVHVAVAVIENAAGEILIAKRPDHVHMGGYWEFPGGKVEAGEALLQALQREILEELSLTVLSAEPLLKIPFQYPDKHVLLDVWRVTDFSGNAQGCEGQQILWVKRNALSTFSFPPANRHILTALSLGERMLITGSFATEEECLARTSNAILQYGVSAVQMRAHHLSEREFCSLAEKMQILCGQLAVKLLLNMPPEQWGNSGDGLHLTSHQLRLLQTRPIAEDVLLGASCHNREELELAQRMGVDYVLLSPVLPTTSHPQHVPLGWEVFAELAGQNSVPVFALGGVRQQDLSVARKNGAAGIAGISVWW